MAPAMAVKVQNGQQENVSLRAAEPVRRMNRDFQIRFTAILLALLTTAAVVYAGYNFSAERQFQVPNDGVWWFEHQGKLTANRVEAGGPGTRAGVKVGDQLAAIDEHEVESAAGRSQQLYRVGAWSKATYSLVRQSVPVDVVLIPVPADRSAQRLAAADWPDLSLHWAVCFAATLDRARFDSLLYLLPGFVHFLLVPLHAENSTGLIGRSTGATWWRVCCRRLCFCISC